MAGSFECEPGTHRAGAHAEQDGDVMNLAAIARLNGQANLGAHAGFGEGMMHGARGHGHGNRQ